ARRFVTLSIDGDESLSTDLAIVVDGAQVGEVRSVQRTPRFGLLALAVVDEELAVDGMQVLIGDEARPATVRPRPIDDGDRARRARP
ncbi:MAG TPA: glycine cleavage T C-terminal barrel domain-containing protein, partial [Actinomycetota bacterium]